VDRDAFETSGGRPVTAVTAAEMAEVDRVAVDEFGLGILQMMENAGRTLARQVRAVAAEGSGESVLVLAGAGGNGGGGLCAARHLTNHGVRVAVVLDRSPEQLSAAPRTQFETLDAMGVPVAVGPGTLAARDPAVVVDALVGYGLDGPLRGAPAELIAEVPDSPRATVSLDVPSGTNATTGERSGPAVDPDRVVTLALPKTGLAAVEADLVLADLGIPAGVYEALELPYEHPFRGEHSVTFRH
jgi:NAD(P)H-hydrate epimerase